MEIDFQKLMSDKSDEQLRGYLDNRAKFTAEAIDAALSEIQKRGQVFSEEELEVYRQEIRQKTKFIAKDVEQDKLHRIKYLWGLFGFIPMLGAIVGFVLMMLGIIHYKDKVLTMIGAVCILFTVLLYASLFFQSW